MRKSRKAASWLNTCPRRKRGENLPNGSNDLLKSERLPRGNIVYPLEGADA